MDDEIITETDAYRMVRRFSDAGHTDTVEWKPGHEPPPVSICSTCGSEVPGGTA